MVPTVGLDLQGPSVEICEEERGEEKGSSESEALDSVKLEDLITILV